MVSVTYATEVLSAAVHTLTSLSVIVAHLASNDPLGAVTVTLIGCFCLLAVTLVGCGCEVVRWRVRQYIRARELAATTPVTRRREG